VRSEVVPKLDDAWMAIESGLYDAALNAASAAVDEPNLSKARIGSRVDVFLDDRGDIARRERVEIDFGLDGDSDGL
jgi:hypothetical protein